MILVIQHGYNISDISYTNINIYIYIYIYHQYINHHMDIINHVTSWLYINHNKPTRRMGLQMDLGYQGSWICQGVWHSLSKAPGCSEGRSISVDFSITWDTW